MSLHPTAVIHPDAQLGTNVTVGPYAVIEGAAAIGDDCTIQAHAVIGAQVRMGRGNTIGYGAIIAGDPQDFAFRPETRSEVVLGDDNKIREYVTIHRGTAEGSATIVGDRCFLMAGAHLAHNVRLESDVILANNALLAGYVVVEDRVFVGGGCVFHQNMRIGRLAMCQGLSGFGKDIPPYCIAGRINGIAGLNVVGMRRAGLDGEARAEIKAAFTLLYRSGLNVSQALAASADRQWGEAAGHFWSFVADAKKRGLCDLLASRSGGSGAGED